MSNKVYITSLDATYTVVRAYTDAGQMNEGVTRMMKESGSASAPDCVIQKHVQARSMDPTRRRLYMGDISVGNIKKEIELLQKAAKNRVGPQLYGYIWPSEDRATLYIECIDMSLYEFYSFEMNRVMSAKGEKGAYELFMAIVKEAQRVGWLTQHPDAMGMTHDDVVDLSAHNIGVNVDTGRLYILDWGATIQQYDPRSFYYEITYLLNIMLRYFERLYPSSQYLSTLESNLATIVQLQRAPAPSVLSEDEDYYEEDDGYEEKAIGGGGGRSSPSTSDMPMPSVQEELDFIHSLFTSRYVQQPIIRRSRSRSRDPSLTRRSVVKSRSRSRSV